MAVSLLGTVHLFRIVSVTPVAASINKLQSPTAGRTPTAAAQLSSSPSTTASASASESSLLSSSNCGPLGIEMAAACIVHSNTVFEAPEAPSAIGNPHENTSQTDIQAPALPSRGEDHSTLISLPAQPLSPSSLPPLFDASRRSAAGFDAAWRAVGDALELFRFTLIRTANNTADPSDLSSSPPSPLPSSCWSASPSTDLRLFAAAPRAALLHGGAGVGKSRFLREIEQCFGRSSAAGFVGRVQFVTGTQLAAQFARGSGNGKESNSAASPAGSDSRDPTGTDISASAQSSSLWQFCSGRAEATPSDSIASAATNTIASSAVSPPPPIHLLLIDDADALWSAIEGDGAVARQWAAALQCMPASVRGLVYVADGGEVDEICLRDTF
jgi:hypothetical protein